ncbi:Cof-type HAD-IIB family hydrolase [Bacteroidales bacterium OttesenSCG-928-C03]|nr:Cof-type HAD-IIB family hydrolase [Bacteroidales bacterium OttesenSCG-928-C03]MDL2325495.1 Cof-type HAD-IIB family hydrolase [Bacteroidales bacterium OttesenSCG-928-A14]
MEKRSKICVDPLNPLFPNIHNIKIAFFDVDGTLVDFQHDTPSNSTLTAIRELKNKGIITCICSGRHILDVRVLNLPDFDGYITTNGACVELNGKTLSKKYIPCEDMERLIAYQQGEHRFPCIIETKDRSVLNFSDQWVEFLHKELIIRTPELVSLEEWIDVARQGVEQMLGFFPGEKDEEFLREILPGSAIKRWCSYFTDIVEKSCDKASAIDVVLEHLNLKPENAIAFGDGGNDIDMLRHVGFGIAMGNAKADVKAAADYVTDNVDADGIFNAVKWMNI